MDSGPFRVPQPADRRVVNRAEPARQPEEQQSVKQEPKTMYRTDTLSGRAPIEKKFRKRRIIIPVVAVILVIIIAVVGWFAWSNAQQKASTAIDTSKYQAVFFTNGQVYFGKLKPFNDDSMKLTDIYYLQTQTTDGTNSKNPQSTSSDQTSNSVQLVKLGDEVHGPEDEMVLSKAQVLFYENLKTDGKVAQSIATYKTTHK